MSDDDRTKAWEALREGAVRAIEGGALDTPEGRSTLAKLFTLPLVPKWGKAPEEARCTKCGAGDLDRSFILMGSPFSGMVRCPSCGHQESVMSQIAKTLVTVEPLQEVPTNRKSRRAKR